MSNKQSIEALMCEGTMFADSPEQRLQHALSLANSSVGSTKEYWLKQAEEIQQEIDSNVSQKTEGK